MWIKTLMSVYVPSRCTQHQTQRCLLKCNVQQWIAAIVVTRFRVYACAPNQTCCSENTEGLWPPWGQSRVVNDHRWRRAFVIKPASPEKSLDPHCPPLLLLLLLLKTPWLHLHLSQRESAQPTNGLNPWPATETRNCCGHKGPSLLSATLGKSGKIRDPGNPVVSWFPPKNCFFWADPLPPKIFEDLLKTLLLLLALV